MRGHQRALTHTHGKLAVNSWECLQCERVVRSPLSVSHNDPCTVCVCSAPNSNSMRFRPLAIQAHSEAGFCEDSHKPGRLGPRVALRKQGPSSLRNHLEFQKCTWYISPRVFTSSNWYCFGIPIRVTEILAVHYFISLTMAVTKTNLLSGRSWYTKFTKPVGACCLSACRAVNKNVDKQWTPDCLYQMNKRHFLFYCLKLHHTFLVQ